jgi:hypothetical protein
MTKYVYSFGNGTADGDGKMKDVLGGKGAGLAEMCRAKLPVPPGFTVSTQVCNIYFQNNNTVPREIHAQMLDALKTLEERMGQKLGDTSDPIFGTPRLRAAWMRAIAAHPLAYLAHRASPEETFLTFARRHDGETLRKLADAEVSS